MVRTERKALRREMILARATQSDAAVQAASERVCARLFELPALHAAQRVAVYAALPGEINLARLIDACFARNIEVAFPRVSAKTPPELTFHVVTTTRALFADRFNILSPAATAPAIALACVDVVLVPGVAFDRTGNRLGFGGGYYDHALASAKAPLRVGICHDFQLTEMIPPRPADAHQADEAVDLVVTPSSTVVTHARDAVGARP